MRRRPPGPTLTDTRCPSTTLFRSSRKSRGCQRNGPAGTFGLAVTPSAVAKPCQQDSLPRRRTGSARALPDERGRNMHFLYAAHVTDEHLTPDQQRVLRGLRSPTMSTGVEIGRAHV